MYQYRVMTSPRKCKEINTYPCAITGDWCALFYVHSNGPVLHLWANTEEEAYSQMAEKLMRRRNGPTFP